jgi:hypothetical protein
VEELAKVVAINVERETAFDQDEVLEDPMDVLDICLSLVLVVMIEEPSLSELNRRLSTISQTATLAHYSVQEYLVSARICQGRAARYSMQPAACHGYIAKGSIGYLLQFEKGLFDRFQSAGLPLAAMRHGGGETYGSCRTASRNAGRQEGRSLRF